MTNIYDFKHKILFSSNEPEQINLLEQNKSIRCTILSLVLYLITKRTRKMRFSLVPVD